MSLCLCVACESVVCSEQPFARLRIQNTIHFNARGEIKINPQGVRNFPPILNAFRHEETRNGFELSKNVRENTRSIIDSLNRKLNDPKIRRESRDIEIREVEAELDRIVDLDIYEKCIDASRMMRFYEVGPLNFAKELGASPNDLTVFKERIVELNPTLLKKIGGIESESLRMLFSELGNDNARILVDLTLTTLESRRMPTIVPLLFGLSEFEKGRFSPSSLIEQHPSFAVDLSITPGRFPQYDSDPINALMLSLGDAGMLKKSGVSDILGPKFDALTNLTIEYQKERGKLPLELQAQATEKYNSSVKKGFDEVQAIFTTAEWKTISKFKFWILIGCYGPSAALFSDDSKTCLDLKLGKTHFAHFSERAKEVRPLVTKSCLEVQRAFIEEVFLKDNANAELRKGFAWAKSDSLIGIPAIDLLYHYGSQ